MLLPRLRCSSTVVFETFTITMGRIMSSKLFRLIREFDEWIPIISKNIIANMFSFPIPPRFLPLFVIRSVMGQILGPKDYFLILVSNNPTKVHMYWSFLCCTFVVYNCADNLHYCWYYKWNRNVMVKCLWGKNSHNAWYNYLFWWW